MMMFFPYEVLGSSDNLSVSARNNTREDEISTSFYEDVTAFHKFTRELTGDKFLERQIGCLYEEVNEHAAALAQYKEAPNKDTFAELLKEAADVSFCGINVRLYAEPEKQDNETFSVDVIFSCYPFEIEPVARDKKLFYPVKIKSLYAKVLGLVAKDNLAKIQNAEIVDGKVKGVNHNKRAIYVEINRLIDETFKEIAELAA